MPNTVKEVKSFLGFVGFYRRFIKDFAKIAAPLHDLTKNNYGGKITWNENCQRAFEMLKDKIMTKVVLSFVDFSKPFFLEIDACKDGLGAIISQEINGERRPIAFASRKLKKGEVPTNEFSSKRLEFLALRWALTEKFKEYFYFQKVFVLTDSDPLSYLKTSKSLNSHDIRWASQLDQFDYEIKYRAGSCNRGADALSRKVDDCCVTENKFESASEEIVSFAQNVTSVANEMSVISHDELKLMQHSDLDIQNFLMFYDSEISPEAESQFSYNVKQMLKYKENFCFKNGLLYYFEDDNYRLVVPVQLIEKILNLVHDRFGHQGIARTLSIAKDRYFWFGMSKDITQHIQNCDRCTRAKSPPRKIVTPMESIVATRPLEIIALDFITVEKSSDNFETILVLTDVFTKFSQAIPTRDQTAVTTAKVLINEWFYKYGIPAKIHTDQGSNFQSELMKQIYKLYSIAKSKTAPYRPMGNGQCERFNRTMLGLLRTLENKHKRKWPHFLKELVFVYNCTPHGSTGFAPYYLMFGRMPRTVLDNVIEIQNDNNDNFDVKEYVANHCKNLESAYEIANEKLDIARQKRKQFYDKKAKSDLLEVGSLVYLRSHPKGRSKIQDRFGETIFKISKYNGNNVYTIIPAVGNIADTKVVNRAEIIKCPLIVAENVNLEEILPSPENSEISDNDKNSDTDSDYDLEIKMPFVPNYSSDESSSSDSSDDDDREVPIRRSSRINKGVHSNPFNLPKSALSY